MQSDQVANAIKNINNSISERLSLLILTAAAHCVHHVTPDKRVELLEQVTLHSPLTLTPPSIDSPLSSDVESIE